MGELRYSTARGSQQQGLTSPMVWRYGQMQPTSWDDALDLVARVTTTLQEVLTWREVYLAFAAMHVVFCLPTGAR